MKNRNKKGQFARNETKNIVAVMVTVSIVISIAFFAKEQAIRHNMVLVEQAKAEMEYGSGLSEDIPEFDLRTAVIFSEILTKKYNA